MDAFLQRRVDEHLEELARGQRGAGQVALAAERRDERAKDDQPGIRHQARDFGDAADVLGAVGLREAEVLVEAVPDVVAVEHDRVHAGEVEAALDLVGDRRLARARQAGEPQRPGPLVLEPGTIGAGDRRVLPEHVGGAAQAVGHHTGGDGLVALAVDQDEGAGGMILGVDVEGQRRVGGDRGAADLVEAQCRRRVLRERVDVEPVGQPAYVGRYRACAELQQIGSAEAQRLVAHPDEVGGEAVIDRRPRAGMRQHVAAGDVDLVGERQRHGIAGARDVEVAVGGDDAGDGRGASGTGDDDGLADHHAPAGDRADEAAEVEVGPVDPLDRHAERPVAAPVGDVHGLEMGDQRRAAVPGHSRARFGQIVPVARRERDRGDVGEAETRGEAGEIGDDAVEHRLAVVDEIDLVHRQHDVADAEKRGDRGMAMGLRQQALARIHQQDREVGARGAGRHVAGVLLVARRVGDDEAAPRRLEIAVGDIDGDALLAFGLQPVDQQREIDALAGGAVLDRVALERGELVVEDLVLLPEQAADQGRLAVVDGAAGDEAQRRPLH